ncbi:membrane hypothetical protein [Gammaproteobacteria bacterium]
MVEPQLPKLMAWVRFPSPAPLPPLDLCVPGNPMRLLVLPVVILMLAGPAAVQAQQPFPLIEELASPYTDSELGGLGCLTASAATTGTLVYLLGGLGRIVSSLRGPLPPARVMEGTAAMAFIFSSACYVGAALAPVAMMAYNSVTDRLPEQFPTFFGFGGASAGDGTSEIPEKSSP